MSISVIQCCKRPPRRLDLQWGPGLFGTPKNLKLHFWADFRVFITMGNPIIGRNFRFFRCRIFKNRKVFGEKNEKSKIASQDFKQWPWATQSPNMSFQLPLGSKIIAVEIWRRKSGKIWESRPDLSHFQWRSHCKWFRTLDPPQKIRSNLNSYNLWSQRQLEAQIRWLCSSGA